MHSHRFASFAPLVLVADDEEIVRSVLQRSLERHGFRVMLARDGQEALELFEQHREQIQLVLLDVLMPRLDGPQALAQMMESEPNLVSCFMTGHAGKYEEKDLFRAGARRVFAKPFRLAEVLHSLRELCGVNARCA